MASRARLKRRLRALGEREDEARRDLGVLVLEMYRREQLDAETLGERAMELASLGGEIESLRGQLGEPLGAEEPVASHPVGEPERVEQRTADAPAPLPSGGSPPPADTLPAGEQGDGDEPERPSPAQAVPPDRAADDLTMQVEDAERRLREAEDALREDEETRSEEILALEEALDGEKRRVAEALEVARARLEGAGELADRERERLAAAARAEAAEWLRGQARAMRREAERQVREELAESTSSAETEPRSEPAPGDA